MKILLILIFAFIIIRPCSSSKETLESYYEVNGNQNTVKLVIQSSDLEKFEDLIKTSQYEVLNMNKYNSDEIEVLLRKKGE